MHCPARWFYLPDRDEYQLSTPGDFEPDTPVEVDKRLLSEEVQALILYLRDQCPSLLGVGIRRDPEDVKMLNRLLDLGYAFISSTRRKE